MYEEGFQHAWEAFLAAEKVPVYNPTQTASNRGRRQDITLAIRLRPDQIPRGVRQMVRQLKRCPAVRIFPEDHYHISVKLIGFLAEQQREHDDIAGERLEMLRNLARQLLARATPFSISLRRLNVLGSYVVVEADDGGYIPSLQNAFHEEVPEIPEYQFEGSQWLPHLSIGAFRTLTLTPCERETLIRLHEIRGGLIQVDVLDLVQAELRYPLPVLHTLEHYPLTPSP